MRFRDVKFQKVSGGQRFIAGGTDMAVERVVVGLKFVELLESSTLAPGN